jgi:hypothetical protein
MGNLPINSPIKGPGLNKPGVVIMQFLIIFFFEGIEIFFRNSPGIITGLAIWLAFLGAIYLGRPGTAYVTAVAPPVALLVASIILMPTVGDSTFAPTKLLIDLVAGLASVSFYLITGAAIAWFIWFKKERTKKSGSPTSNL